MIRCLTVCVLFLASTVHADDAKKEKPKLEGTWVATSYKRGPGEIGKDKVDTELTIAKDAYEYPKGINRVSKKGALKIDEAKGTIDFTPEDGPAKGKTLQGIYKIEDKVLTLCYTGTGGARPTEFKSGDRNTVVATFERK